MFVPQLNILRFLAALAIVVFHYSNFRSLEAPACIENLVVRGNQAVTFFFFLSGFVMYLSYSKRTVDFRSFMRARIARIMPLYWLVFSICLILILVFTDDRPKGINVILQFFAVHAWFPGKALELNYPSWSISVEFAFYAICPFLFGLIRRFNFKKFAMFALSVWLCCQLVHILLLEGHIVPNVEALYQLILYHPLMHMGTFLFGMIAANMFMTWKDQITIRVARLLWGAGIAIWLYLMMSDNPIIPYGHNGLFSPIYAVILIGISRDSGWHINLISHKLFITAGNVSYGIYILQAALAMILIDEFGWSFFPFLIVLISLSWILYVYFEKPAQKWILGRK